jgi:Phage integrase family
MEPETVAAWSFVGLARFEDVLKSSPPAAACANVGTRRLWTTRVASTRLTERSPRVVLAGGARAGHVTKGRAIPTRPVKLKAPRRLPGSLTVAEVTTILAACVRLRDRFLFALLAETGMRIGQALGLRHADFVSRRRQVTIVPRGDNANGARAKTRVVTSVPVSTPLVRLYSDYLHTEFGELDSDYVFVNLWAEPKGRPLRYDTVQARRPAARGHRHRVHAAPAAPHPGHRADPRRRADRGRVEDADPQVGCHHQRDLRAPERGGRPSRAGPRGRVGRIRRGASMTATLLALPAPSGRTLHERLLEIVRPEFRAEVVRVAADDPVFGRGACDVDQCRRSAWTRRLCHGHYLRWRRDGKPDLPVFAATTGPIAETPRAASIGAFDLRALRPQARLEVAYVIQCRQADRAQRLPGSTVRHLVGLLADADADSLLDVPLTTWLERISLRGWADPSRTVGLVRYAWHRLSDLAEAADAESEFARDTWRVEVLGLGVHTVKGTRLLHFDTIAQPWLRAPLKRFARFRLATGKAFSSVDSMSARCGGCRGSSPSTTPRSKDQARSAAG